MYESGLKGIRKMQVEQLINSITQIYKGLIIEKAERNDFGQNNDVIIINDSIVFRFPRYYQGIKNLKKEVSLLILLGDHVSTPIPSPEYTFLEKTDPGTAFAGYNMLPGTPMWNRELENLNLPQLKDLASQLMNFLINLHSIPLETFQNIFEQVDGQPIMEIEQFYARLQDKVFPFMRQEAKESVSNEFESFIKKEKARNAIPSLIHGDFGASNILWQAENCEVTGIIDFGGAGIGDPAYDLAGVLSSYGEAFFNLCIDLYPSGDEIRERVKFYRSTFALQEALHGIENCDEQAFKNGIHSYQ
jgi:aminoglycoside 2''-phosphotransferase